MPTPLFNCSLLNLWDLLPDDQWTSALNMKPVSYQSMPSSMNGGHPALDRVLGTSNVMYCEKCGFGSTDAAAFKKHMVEHMGTRFYCFYCNNVSFSEAELNAHLKQHTAKYPFKCPHCGQGYMRRLCLVKHIDRLHSKGISFGPAKPGTTKNSHVPVSSALPSVPTADTSSIRPLVRVTVPTPSVSAFRLGKDEQRGKTLDTNVSNAPNGNAELLSPLNGLIQHNRALTVSLPEEVTIPAGCLVELVEVKTVNGTKELKLRLVSQQENESVIKDTRTSVSQNTALGKPLSSTLNHPNTVKSTSLGMCTVNRKQYETKTVNVDRPAVVPVNISKNLPPQINKDKSVLKRTSQEIINLECHTPIPNKVPKSTLNPAREGNSGIKVTQREPVNHNAAPPAITSTRVANRLTSTLHPDNMGACVSQRAVDERKNLIPEHSKSIPPRRASDIKSIPRDGSVAVKLEPREINFKNNAASKIKNQQSLKSASPSLSVPSAAAAQVRPPAILVCKDNVVSASFSVPRTLNELTSFKMPVLSNRTNSKISAWNQESRSNERTDPDPPEPEGFPVISSVFSLCQQPEDVQGSIQPLVMALRGIVMDKSNSSGSTMRDHVKIPGSTQRMKEAAPSGHCAQVATKDGSFIRDLLLAGRTSESVKVEEQHRGIQNPPALTNNHTHVKEEKNNTAPTNNNQCSQAPESKLSTDKEAVSETAAHVDGSGTADPLQQMEKSDHDISSKFLTVSLKRVQVGVWKKNKKGLKLRISKYKTQVPMDGLTDCTVIHPMPLKVDQLVKRPGPNQPVVVLNHPKPRASIQGARADTLADTGASEVVPKCQILKMRLSKVMGQKYEVMGCTVGVFP
ncbi:RE1-silencing transcription factor [Dicentrarchus labrax]|uniref:C2H2-type domain-containing protein n=1 Tax=Dicentrarchus labrax TaxID=13489 RepID=A0A8P4GED3_DICLA|nr:RE1-silencing transcription factor [Dicentrarchus labrax]XP_051276302.1 RE1-silencing transcription factor [Dicentrarchus labrax]